MLLYFIDSDWREFGLIDSKPHHLVNKPMRSSDMKVKPSLALATALIACSSAWAATQGSPADEIYTADLQPMNAALTRHETTGKAEFVIHGDELTITVNVKDAPPNITHWQHFHGFKGSAAASCATQAADTNGDGIVDLIETESASGTTMVPFDDSPSAMNVAHGVYPQASPTGSYEYRKAVSIEALAAAFAKAFDGQKLDLDKRVVLIHGVPSDTKLPSTVQSLGPIPAHVTVPIACGEIVRGTR